jgi:ribosomal protein S18 acetylase RimI-like enzyme
MSLTIRPAAGDESAACERILRALPQWFGIEASLRQYAEDTRRWPTFFADTGSGPVGVITLHEHFADSAEIHLIAVAPERRGQGVGCALVHFAEDLLRARGVRFLQVKTQGPSRPCEYYSQTRAFYQTMGFAPLEEFPNLWPGNPCLLMVKAL